MGCHFYNANQATFLSDLENISITFSTVSGGNLVSLLLYGVDKYTKNRKILMSAIGFTKDSQSLNEKL